MFDRLDDLLIRYEEVMGELQEPGAADDQAQRDGKSGAVPEADEGAERPRPHRGSL